MVFETLTLRREGELLLEKKTNVGRSVYILSYFYSSPSSVRLSSPVSMKKERRAKRDTDQVPLLLLLSIQLFDSKQRSIPTRSTQVQALLVHPRRTQQQPSSSSTPASLPLLLPPPTTSLQLSLSNEAFPSWAFDPNPDTQQRTWVLV